MANTLMFEVGIKRANEEYNKILEEVKALAKMADNSISLKVQLEKSNDLKTFLDALKQLGDGKMLEPLLHKIDNLQASMVRLGMIPKDIDYSNLEKQLQKVTVAYENYQKAREKAGLKEGQADVTGPTMALGQVYRTARANLEKEFGLSENVARATMDTFKNMGNTIQENMARIGGSKAGMESLSGEVGGLTTKVDALVNAFSSLVSQLKSLGTGSGVKDMATDVAKVDEGTSKMAQALAKAFGNLNEKKADVKVSEDSLATATNTAAAALKAEEAQAQATAASILRVADSISVATLATKNLYTILGGNREDIAKFLELANTMDMLSRKSAYIMSSGESFSGGKMGAFTEVKKEMEAVQSQMDELKKSGLSGSPIIDSFATAFKNLSEVLTAAGTSVKESTKNLKSLGEGAKNLEKISESQERANRAKNQTTESIQKETQARKKNAAAVDETSSAEDKAASASKANAEAIQKLLTATQELTTATNNLKMAIGSWGQDKGTIATMVAQFEELRKKITQVVEQWEKLAMVKATGVQNVQVPSFNIDLSSIEPTIKTLNEAVAQLKKSMDLLWESTNRMESSLKAIVTPETFKKVESDAASAKQKVDELSKSVEGMKMQSEKKGSETTLNANLDVLKNHTKNVYEALTQIAVEYEKLSNQKLRDDGLEQRLLKLREYYEWLQKVATMTDTLSKPGALKADATKFNGELLMGKQTKEMWSDKAVKDFQKIVEEILSGRRAAESFETAIQKLKERVEEFNSTGSKGFGGVGAAMETINRVGELNIQTLIKEQAHIERMMKLAEGSSKYMEGHKVAGMDKLQAVQDSNMNYLQTLNRWISLILQNRDNPDIIRFLNTPQSLKLPLPGRADDVAMFNAHYDKLKHSITDTSAAARQLVKDMSLTDANASIKQWNTTRLETGLYNVQDAIQGIMRAWRNASQYADEDMTKAVAQQINRLNAIKQEILTAMTNEQLLGTRHGYASVINPDNTHTLKDSKQMVTDLNAFTRERIKAENEYNKEVERFTNQSKKEAARQEQEYQKNVERWQESQMKTYAKAEQEKAKAAIQAQKDIQKEIERTEAQMRKLDSAISRGTATPGRDMTILTDARSKLQGQLNLLKGMTPADMQNNVLVEKRIKNIRTLRDDTDALRKSEERLTTAQQQSNRRSDRADDKRLKDEIKSVNDAYVKYNELGAKLNELQALRARGITANVDVSGLDRYIEYLEKVRQLMKEIYSNNGRTSNTATVQDFGIRQGMLASEALAHNNVKSSSFYNKNNLSQFTQDLRDAESRMKAAQRTAENLGNRIDKLNLVKVDFAKAGIDTTPLQNAIDKIRAIQQELANFGRTGFSSYGTSGKEIASNMGLNAANKEANDAIHQLNINKRVAANVNNQLTESEQRLANSIRGATDSMKGQSQVLSDLKMLAMQYISVWGAQSFINSIIETGGLLEQQRLSIGAILQNAGQATELFGQIKALAVKSPFGVVELDKMSKQLTAYGFEYKELYDWTKRLADISAATGTSVDRLALALGHVRSEGALSGYTLRQFAMGNVPVLRMLSENLGISTKQVREKVRKKEISYEDVQEVLRQLTDEGGMFYEAQEVMSQALNAKFKNLRDAFDIMYGEIAESGVGTALKKIAETLTAGAKEWGRYGKDMLGVVGVLGVAKIATLAYNQAIGANTVSVLNQAAAHQKEEVNILRLAKEYRALTAEEWKLLATHSHWYATSGKLTASNLAVLLSTKKLSQEELFRAVALGKINKELALEAVLAMKAATAEERHAKAVMLWELRSVTSVSKMRVAWITLGNAIRKAGSAIWSFGKIALPMAALTVIMDMFARVSEMKSKAEEASHDLAEKATSDLKVLGDIFKELQDDNFIKSIDEASGKFVAGKRVVSNLVEFNDDALSKEDLTQRIEELKNKLADLSPMYEGDLVDIDKMNNQVEQFKLIVRKLESIRHANDVTEAMSNVITDADVDVAGSNWFTRLFGDSYTTDIKDYAERLNDAEKDISGINEEIIDRIDKQLGGKIAELQKKYSLGSKNDALSHLFADWAKNGVPNRDIYDTLAGKVFRNATQGGFGRTLRGQYQQLEADTKEMAEKMSSIIVNEFSNDPDGAIYAISTYMKKLLSMSGITDPRVMEDATRLMLEAMREYLPKNMQGSIIDEMQKRILMEQFMGLVGNTIKESTSPEEAEKALQKYSELTIKWGESMGYDMEKLGMNHAEAYRDGLDAKLNAVKLKTDWQKRASQVFVENIAIKTNFDKSLDEFAQAVQKDLKEKQAYLKRNQAHLKMTLNIDTDVLMNADKLRALMDKLAIEGQKKAMNGDWDGAQAIYSRIDKEIKPYYDALMAVQEDKSWLKKEGYPETDPTKGNKGKQEDKEAKRLREIAKLYKDAYDWYNKYEKQVGEAGALKKVQAQFQPLFDEFNKTWKTNLTLDSIPTYKKNLTELLNEAMKLYKTPKHKNSYMVEAIKQLRDAISNVDYEEANRKMDEFASKVKIQLDNLTRSWDLFNSVRESTGDVALANQLSGAKYKNGNTQNLADATRQKIEKDFEEAGGRYSLEFDINLSDDEIQKLFEDTERWGVLESSVKKYQEQIKGLVEEYQKWRDLQRDVYKNDVQIFAKVTGSVMTYEAQLRRINDEYEREVAAITRLRDQRKNGEKDANGNLLGITEEQYKAAMAKLDSDKEWKTFQMGAQYINFMNGAIGQTKKAIEDAAKAVENSLNKAVKKGTIDAKTYAEQMRKIRDVVDKFREDSFFGVQNTITAFMQGGLKGSNEFAKDRLQALETKEKNGGLTEDEEKEKKHLVDLQNKLSKVIGSLSSFATILQMATGVADGLVNATQSLANMFQALGNTGAANFWGDLSDGIKAGTSFLAPANNIVQNAMSGNIGGVVSSVISSPIDMIAAPITGFAKLHDKRRERRIQELKEEVSRIANNTELILKTRQRTLGYDSGNLRQLYSNQYYHQENVDFASKLTGLAGAIIKGSRYGRGFNSAAEEAMYNYYQQNGEGSGYKQQLANLRSEREKYMQMYNEEEDKKDSSGEAMEEYKKKIAELDDQIHYFALDLANELWSIDMKGWAQQLTDALATAFENGTNMAKAYKKAVEDILRSLAGKMMQLAIIEPIMQKLQNKLFGTQNADGTWSGGVFDIDNPEKSAKQVTNIIAKFFGKGGEGEAAIKAGEVFLAEFERGVNQAGLSIKNRDESSLSGSIKSITEETADIIASYVNAIRADVAMNRMFITMFIQEYWASYIEQITSVHTTLRNIDRNVAAMALTFSEAGKIYGMIENISNRLDKFANGVDKISVQ